MEPNQTNMELHSVSIKTEASSEDLHRCVTHSELNLKPDPEECSKEPEQVFFVDTQKDLNIKTEVETDMQENDPLSSSALVKIEDFFHYSLHQQPSSVQEVFRDGIILKQVGSFTDSTSGKEYGPTHSEQRYEPTKQKQLVTHTGEKSYNCGICKKRFNRPGKLKDHLRSHTGEKPYECGTCKKRFTSLSNLRGHSKVHTSEKSYECKICKEKFSRSSALAYHMKTHTDEKPYECKMCNKKFCESESLTIHLRARTGEKPYE